MNNYSENEYEIFSRLFILNEFSEKNLKILSNIKIGIVGIGGIGCPLSQYLVNSGIKNLLLVDGDIVEKSNLNRQILFNLDDIGKKKVDVAREKLKLINTECNINIINKNIDSFNLNYLKECFIVVDATDDWFTSNEVLKNISELNITPENYHLLVSSAVYVNNNYEISRKSIFKFFKNFKISLFLGSTPPHQGTCFSFLLKDTLYNEKYKLAGDLEYYLRISNFRNLRVETSEKVLANMSNGGVSQKNYLMRLREVTLIYIYYFGALFFVPLVARYFIRLKSLIK